MSLYQGANQCQTTLLLEPLAGVSPAFNATLSRGEQATSAEHPPQGGKPSAGFMVVHQLAPKQNKADNVAQRRELKQERTPVKREPNGLRVCVDFVR
jgi:hypothetical protein